MAAKREAGDPDDTGRQRKRPKTASAIAKKDEVWDRWAFGAGVHNCYIVTELPDTAISTSEIFGEQKAPLYLKQMDEKKRDAMRSSIRDFLPSNLSLLEEVFKYVDHAQTYFPLSADMAAQLKSHLPAAVNLSRKLMSLQGFCDSTGGWVCAIEWRQPVDELVARVFSEVDNAQYRFRYQVALPHSGFNDSPKTAILDAAVVLSHHWYGKSEDTPYAEEVCCATTLTPGSFIPVLHWVAEYNPARSRNHLFYGLATAQRQRISMGFSHHMVYGMVYEHRAINVYMSWVEAKSEQAPKESDRTQRPVRILAQRVAKLTLHNPLHAIQFTVLLLKIKTDMRDTWNEFNELTVEKLKVAQATTASWKATNCEYRSQSNPASGSGPGLASLMDDVITSVRSASESEEEEPESIMAVSKAGVGVEANEKPDVRAWADDVYHSKPFLRFDTPRDSPRPSPEYI